jgi:hypothetical protein
VSLASGVAVWVGGRVDVGEAVGEGVIVASAASRRGRWSISLAGAEATSPATTSSPIRSTPSKLRRFDRLSGSSSAALAERLFTGWSDAGGSWPRTHFFARRRLGGLDFFVTAGSLS